MLERPNYYINLNQIVDPTELQQIEGSGFSWATHREEYFDKLSDYSILQKNESGFQIASYMIPSAALNLTTLIHFVHLNPNFSLYDITGGRVDTMFDELENPEVTLRREAFEESGENGSIFLMGKPKFWLVNSNSNTLSTIYTPIFANPVYDKNSVWQPKNMVALSTQEMSNLNRENSTDRLLACVKILKLSNSL